MTIDRESLILLISELDAVDLKDPATWLVSGRPISYAEYDAVMNADPDAFDAGVGLVRLRREMIEDRQRELEAEMGGIVGASPEAVRDFLERRGARG